MSTLRVGVVVGGLLVAVSAAGADLVVEQWGPDARFSHPGALVVSPLPGEGADEGPLVPHLIRVDLKALDRRAEVLHASLHVSRDLIDGTNDGALVDIEIRPLAAARAAGKPPALGENPLELEAPWYRSFDATGIVRAWVKDAAANHGLYVNAIPGWRKGATYLEVTYKGTVDKHPKQVEGLRVLHRSGQTFITWREVDRRVEREAVTWGELKDLLEQMDQAKRVRYRIYAHRVPITAASIADAELLAEVAPLSAYNVLGRSVDQLIYRTRLRAIEDQDLAKRIARSGYFSRFTPDMPEMAEVAIKRFAIEDGKPLPIGTGLYVHHPRRAGRAFYAVAACVNGTANGRDFSAGNSLQVPVDEKTGTGEPVLQGEAKVSVLFDYPGRRLHYVQWAAPPLAHLPDRYFNWGVFVPRGYDGAKVRRLSVFFHDTRQRYLKPPWPHRQDTVLISPHDAPFRSYGYGHHESLGTLRSFKQGAVRPFLARRVDAFLEWAAAKFRPDPGRVSCGGSGFWGGTAALQYGLRRPGRIAYVMADGSPAPDPRQTPYEYIHYPWRRDRPRKTTRPLMDAVWGKQDWDIEAESGKPIWQELDLPAYVRTSKAALPYLSIGAGSMHMTWKQESDLMKAYLVTRNALMSEFFWGGSAHTHLPVGVETGALPFEPRTDRPMLACRPTALSPNPKFYETNFLTGTRGYGGGSRLNNRPRWDPVDIVDRPDRLEMTIFRARKVSYAGNVTVETAVRNARQFKPAPGEKVTWSVVEPRTGRKRQGGEAIADEAGLIVIPGLTFANPARLILERAAKP